MTNFHIKETEGQSSKWYFRTTHAHEESPRPCKDCEAPLLPSVLLPCCQEFPQSSYIYIALALMLYSEYSPGVTRLEVNVQMRFRNLKVVIIENSGYKLSPKLASEIAINK